MRSLLQWLGRLLNSSSTSAVASSIVLPRGQRDAAAPNPMTTHPAHPAVALPETGQPSLAPSQVNQSAALVESTSFYEHREPAVALSRFSVPRAAVVPASVRWVNSGESIRVHEHVITHGMLYLGSDPNSSEPSLINPRLRAAKGTPAPLGYWPSYAGMEPTARSQYLEWLASGASGPIDIGCVFLFFYGLERRLLIDGGPAGSDAGKLLTEIERLLDLYAGNRSFKRYATSLLEFCRASRMTSQDVLVPENCVPNNTYEVPLQLRLALGITARDAVPLASAWAHCWAIADPLISRRTPVTRCPEEFRRAFVHTYTDTFGEGLVLPRNRTVLKANYQPASAGLSTAKIELSSSVPDVLATTAPRKKLQEVVDAATALIETYSRCLSRNQEKRGRIVTLVNLPTSLWPKELLEVVQQLRRESEDFPSFTCTNLLARLGYDNAPTPSFVVSIWQALEDMGVGMEPDVNNGIRRPKPEDAIILFPLQSKTPVDRKSARFNEVSVEVSLAACLALADGHACDRELAHVEQIIEVADDLEIDLRTRLRAQYRLQISKPSPLSALKAKLQNVPESMRLTVAGSLAFMASSDGVVSPEEVRFLETLYKALQLDTKLVYAHLYSDAPHPNKANVDEKQANALASAPAIPLDLDKITRLQAETAQVSALLANVFNEEETEPVAPAELNMIGVREEAGFVPPSLLPGLDSVHNQFLLLLLTRAQWTRGELQDAAADMQLMLDGALERINEAALDATGAALLDGEDPLFVDQTLMETAIA